MIRLSVNAQDHHLLRESSETWRADSVAFHHFFTLSRKVSLGSNEFHLNVRTPLTSNRLQRRREFSERDIFGGSRTGKLLQLNSAKFLCSDLKCTAHCENCQEGEDGRLQGGKAHLWSQFVCSALFLNSYSIRHLHKGHKFGLHEEYTAAVWWMKAFLSKRRHQSAYCYLISGHRWSLYQVSLQEHRISCGMIKKLLVNKTLPEAKRTKKLNR